MKFIPNLFAVGFATGSAVLQSAIGNYWASVWALAFAVAVIGIAKYQDLTSEATKLANDCCDGWKDSQAQHRELIASLEKTSRQ